MFNKEAFTGNVASNNVIELVLLILSSIITAFGEEIGWRGFLLPKLTAIWNLKTAIAVTGVIWALWHFPLMLAGLYQTGTPIWYQLPMFVVNIIAMTTIMGCFRMTSGSVWPAVLLHAFHNYVDQVLCSPLTKADGQAYFVGETGFITAIIMIVLAVIVAIYTKKVLNKNKGDIDESNSCN